MKYILALFLSIFFIWPETESYSHPVYIQTEEQRIDVLMREIENSVRIVKQQQDSLLKL